jgi:hypothetical protein
VGSGCTGFAFPCLSSGVRAPSFALLALPAGDLVALRLLGGGDASPLKRRRSLRRTGETSVARGLRGPGLTPRRGVRGMQTMRRRPVVWRSNAVAATIGGDEPDGGPSTRMTIYIMIQPPTASTIPSSSKIRSTAAQTSSTTWSAWDACRSNQHPATMREF